MKVFRNKDLKGVISKKRALSLLGMKRITRIWIKNYLVEIFIDDMNDVNIDYIIDDESAGGEFEEV